ncbi:MAG: hypothetical protein Q9190_006631, partial [Brigantiaea leucoxantha]
MAPPLPKSATQAEVGLIQLKNCLINLPQSLVNVLFDLNAPVQNVIVEINYDGNTSLVSSGSDAKSHQPRSVFVGWTGMSSKRRARSIVGRGKGTSSSSRNSEVLVVELDAVFGRMLGLTEGQRVGLSLHLDPPIAHTVNIEPLTPGDWEIIELHANFLELNLLSQIRALPNPSFSAPPPAQVQQPHPLTLHLSPTSTANIIVSSLAPSMANTVPFAKIAPDAEVIVAPKIRPRITDRTGSKSNASVGRKSVGGKSGRSAAQQHSAKEQLSRRSLLLRPCARSVCSAYFDEDEPEDRDEGLKVWIDPDQRNGKLWADVAYVCISMIEPPGVQAPLDPQQQQKKKDWEATESGKYATKVVAKLMPWIDSAGDCSIALSSLLTSALGVDDIVGGLVRVEPAPPPLPRSSIKKLKIYPFLPSQDRVRDGIKFGGESQAMRESIIDRMRTVYRSLDADEHEILSGPLTDGLILLPIRQSSSAQRWDGGILRIDPPPEHTDQSDSSTVSWFLGIGAQEQIKVQGQIPTPFETLQSTGPATEALPRRPPVMIGIDDLAEKVSSHLSYGASVMLTGGLGSGKSTLARLLGYRLRSALLYHTQFFSCRTLASEDNRVSTVKEVLIRVFARSLWGSRLGGHSLIILDDIDKLCPAETELQTSDNDHSRQASELLCSLFRNYCKPNSGVVLLATAQSRESVNNIIVSGNITKETVPLKAPDKEGRRRLLEHLVESTTASITASNGANGHKMHDAKSLEADWMETSRPSSPLEIPLFPSADLLDLAGRTDGYMPADLILLVSRARSESLIRTLHSPGPTSLPSLHPSDFAAALKNFTPASLRNVPLQSSSTTFSSIGGLVSTRTLLLETLQYPTLYAPIFAQCPLRLRSGILLYGYPGCGKTLLASAVAGECGLNFISVKGPEILNKYIGASEKSVRDLFERAEAAKPCVLFFDEFDSIAPKRGHDSTGVTDRVVNQMLVQMDGAEGLSGVYVLAATSRPDLIDPALLRPGRLDKSVLCDLPEHEDRLDILRKVSNQLKVEDSVRDEGLEEVAKRTDGYSGADLQAVIYNAHLEAIHDVLGDKTDETTVGRAQKKKKQQQQRPDGEALPKKNSKTDRKDLIQFCFSADADEAEQDLHAAALPSQAKQIADYNSLLAKFEAATTREKKYRRERDANTHTRKNPKEEPLITWHHILTSLSTTRKSISDAERRRLGA